MATSRGFRVALAGLLALGQGSYYLVRGKNACGKGNLGASSAGNLRPDLGACP